MLQDLKAQDNVAVDVPAGLHRHDVLRQIPAEKRCQCNRLLRSRTALERSVPHRAINRLSGIPRIAFTDEELLELVQ